MRSLVCGLVICTLVLGSACVLGIASGDGGGVLLVLGLPASALPAFVAVKVVRHWRGFGMAVGPDGVVEIGQGSSRPAERGSASDIEFRFREHRVPGAVEWRRAGGSWSRARYVEPGLFREPKAYARLRQELVSTGFDVADHAGRGR